MDEEFRVDNFEFKLDRIRNTWADSLFFDFKIHNPNDDSFCRRCLEDSLYDELKPYLKYFGIENKVIIEHCDLSEFYSLERVFKKYSFNIDEVYNF